MTRTLKGQGVPNTDLTNQQKYPYGRAKNATAGSNDGTPLLENTTITDVSYSLLHTINQAGLQPNESPESIEDSQFFDALIRIFGDVGSIIFIIGEPLPGNRLIKLTGQQIDLSLPKYRFLKEWVTAQRAINPSQFVDKDTARGEEDRGRFKVDLNDSNVLILPFLRSPDTLKFGNPNDPGTVGYADRGLVRDHDHVVNDFTMEIPGHSHSAYQAGHDHGRGSMNITGDLRSISQSWWFDGGAGGAFYKPNEEWRSWQTPITVDNSGAGRAVFDASRAWTGRTDNQTPSVTVVSKPAYNTGVKTGLRTGSTGDFYNVPAGVLGWFFIKY